MATLHITKEPVINKGGYYQVEEYDFSKFRIVFRESDKVVLYDLHKKPKFLEDLLATKENTQGKDFEGDLQFTPINHNLFLRIKRVY